MASPHGVSRLSGEGAVVGEVGAGADASPNHTTKMGGMILRRKMG